MKTNIETANGSVAVEIPVIDEEVLKSKAQSLVEGSNFSIEKQDILKFVDLTSLNTDDTKQVIQKLAGDATLHQTASVCVYPKWTADCLKMHPNLTVAVVGNNFPYRHETITQEMTEEALNAGAKEVDMVIKLEDVKALKFQEVFREVNELAELCHRHEAHLKVILETGELEQLGQISALSEIAILAGADFIKTSTGKVSVNATPEAAVLMLETIKKMQKPVGFKSAGGIRTYEDALVYFKLVHSILGDEWISPDRFRIGASSLMKDLVD